MNYYFVSYTYTNKKGNFGFGNAYTETTRAYLNMDQFVQDTMAANPNMDSVVVLNIVELMKTEFDELKASHTHNTTSE